MSNIECIIVYLRVEDKLIPEIYYGMEPDFYDAVDHAVKIEQLKVEA
jgi:hypothetical protein